VAELAAGEGRLAINPGPSPSGWAQASLVAAHAPVGATWGAHPERATPHFAAASQAAFAWLADDVDPDARDLLRRVGGAFGRMLRVRWLLDEFDARIEQRWPGPPWYLLAYNERFILWERHGLPPVALGYRAYQIAAGPDDLRAAVAVYRAYARRTLTLHAEGSLASLPRELVNAARAVVTLAPDALADVDAESWAPLGERVLRFDSPAGFAERLDRLYREWPKGELVRVDDSRPAPDRIELSLDAGSAPALVLVSEAYHPGWRATLDGHPAPVLRAQLALLAIPVPPGPHTLALRFEAEEPKGTLLK
jgi:hypothetical protein